MEPLVEEVEELVARVGVQPIWGYSHCLKVHALAVVLPNCVEKLSEKSR
jgi:hypothetical protein